MKDVIKSTLKKNLAVFFFCLLIGKIGTAFLFLPGMVSSLWPPTGVALVLVLFWGNTILPALCLATFLSFTDIVWHYQEPSFFSFGAIFFLTFQFLASIKILSYILQTRCKDILNLTDEKDISIFIIAGGVLIPALNALVYAIFGLAEGFHLSEVVLRAAITRFVGDSISILLLTPLGIALLSKGEAFKGARRWVIAGPLFLSFTIICSLFFTLKNYEEDAGTNLFQDKALALSLKIEEKFKEIIGKIYSLNGFYLSSIHVDREEFHTFINKALTPIQGVSYFWIPRILEVDKNDFLKDLRANEGTELNLFKLAEDRKFHAPKQNIYFPIFYATNPDKTPFGWDFSSDQFLLNGLSRSLNLKREVLIPFSSSYSEGRSGLGNIVLLFPIVKKNNPSLENVEGFIGAFITPKLFIDQIFSVYPEYQSLKMFLAFSHPILGKEPIYGKKHPLDESSMFQFKHEFKMGEGLWGIEIYPIRDSIFAPNSWFVVGIFFGAVIFSAMLSGILLLISGREYFVNELVKCRSDELAVEKEKAESASKAKSDFLANVSHEIRTPLNAIIGMTTLLKNSQLTDEQKDQVNSVLTSSESLLQLINDILDFSKIEARKLEIEAISFSLREILGNLAEMLSVTSRQKNLEFIISEQEGIPKQLVGDPGRLKQILINLIGNAIKFTDKGHILLKIQIIDYKNDKINLKFSIADSGIGISPEKLTTIFNEFDQGDTSTTRKYGGTGLGLAVTRQLCTLLGGKIGVASKPGAGTTFAFALPFKVEQGVEEAQNFLENHCLKDVKIALFEPYGKTRSLLEGYLIRAGGVVTPFESIKLLLSFLNQGNTFDIAIVSLEEPDLSFKESCALIAKLFPQELPLLLTSANPYDGRAYRILEVMGKGFLKKPLLRLELLEAASQILKAKTGETPLPFVTRYFIRKSQEKRKQVTLQDDFTGCHLLLVDDNPLNVKVAQAFLEKLGCTAKIASNGVDAVHLFRKETFDAILMDCQMPEMDGYEATRQIRAVEKKRRLNPTPIIALTAHAMIGDDKKCYEAGMDGYLTKPLRPDVLQEKLSEHIKKFLVDKSES